jgi:hypothetical protein
MTEHATGACVARALVLATLPGVQGTLRRRRVRLDTDLSVVATLGENEYSHVMPRSVSDANRDGLDEIWADLVGYEGANAGLIYWRPRARSFDVIATTYFGL